MNQIPFLDNFPIPLVSLQTGDLLINLWGLLRCPQQITLIGTNQSQWKFFMIKRIHLMDQLRGHKCKYLEHKIFVKAEC